MANSNSHLPYRFYYLQGPIVFVLKKKTLFNTIAF